MFCGMGGKYRTFFAECMAHEDIDENHMVYHVLVRFFCIAGIAMVDYQRVIPCDTVPSGSS